MDWQAALAAFFLSWQVRATVGLIVADLGLGVASALARNAFHFEQVANFYRTNVAPYILGYLTLYVVVKVILPPGVVVPGLTALPVNEAAVSLAWAAIALSLGSSIGKNFRELYAALLSRAQPPAP